jgi:type IV secretion system protein VirD4
VDPKYHIRLGFKDDTPREPLDYDGEAHGLLCAPTRAGKFRDVLAQILMTFEGSCFVVDPKGQAAAVTARYRQDVLKQDVCVLNPFNILPDYLEGIRQARYDPITSNLDINSPNFAADADNLMEGLMPHMNDRDAHWIDSARILGSGIAMWEAIMSTPKEPASLASIYKIISGADLFGRCEAALRIIEEGGDVNSGMRLTQAQFLAAEFVTERLSRFMKTARDSKEIQSVVSTAITQLAFMGNKPIAESLSASNVDFREMRNKPMTVYLILPGRYMASSAKWFRLITNSWADSCLHEGKGSIPILGILDEFASAIGKLGSIETLLRLAAGYGTRLVTVIQDLPSLKELYPRSWETFLSASEWQLYFAPRDWTTSEYCSRMSGTVDVPTFQQSTGPNSPVTSGMQHKPAMMPEDIRRLPDDTGFLLDKDGCNLIGRRAYYDPKSKEFEGRYRDDPYHPRGKG